jgi:FkbM family methyltransferase
VAGAFRFRAGSYDERIFQVARAGQDYRLPDRFHPEDIVVDIGMHVGGFALAALERGCAQLHGFEAEASNFAGACANLSSFGARVHLYQKAVWRSDIPAGRLKFTGSYVHANTGGGGFIFWENAGGIEQDVQAVAFDDVIRALTTRGRRISFLKIDCEGSEFPILLTSRLLHRIDTIAGEFHEVGGLFDSHTIPERARVPGVSRFTIEVLAAALTRAGFQVEWERSGETYIGLFRAERVSPTNAIGAAWKTFMGSMRRQKAERGTESHANLP